MILLPRSVKVYVATQPVDVHELSMLLEGIAFTHAKCSSRWEPPMHAHAS